jgi:hypothetical protein
MPQTTYSAKPALAYQGMVADVGMDNIIVSRTAKALLHVGVMIQMAGNPLNPPAAGQCQELPDSAAALGVWGISVYDTSRMPYTPDANAKAQYAIGDSVPMLTRGRIWVWTENATAQDDPVYVRVLAAGSDTKGQFRNATATNFIVATGCRWQSSTTAAGLIILEIR